jgi:hypothetical protein
MRRKPEKPKEEPDGFICQGCGRNVFSMKLAPLCLRCRLLKVRLVRRP